MNNKKNRNKKDVLIASIVMVMIGVLLVAAGFLIYRSNAAKIEKSQKTIAVIDKIETHKKYIEENLESNMMFMWILNTMMSITITIN